MKLLIRMQKVCIDCKDFGKKYLAYCSKKRMQYRFVKLKEETVWKNLVTHR